jgi:4'-phosphopantetheinyl transferase
MTPTIKWQKELSEPCGLPGDYEIHLWQTDLDDPAPDYEALFHVLSSRDRERARRFVFEQDCRRFVVARAWLRSMLGCYLNVPPPEVPLAAGAHGKPHLAAEINRAGVEFNLSHCGRVALLAVATKHAVGVDVQEASPNNTWSAIARRFCTAEEWEHLRAVPPVVRVMVFSEIWTRKEAAGKAAGEGLTSGILSLSVGPADWGTVVCGGGLSVWSLPAQNRFSAAIAVRA